MFGQIIKSMRQNRNGKWIINGIFFLLYLLLFLFFLDKYWFAFGPDFVSYSAIAKQYAAGNFSQAVNSWWPPLYSWLLALLFHVIPDPLFANKILQFGFGAYGYWVGKLLIQRIARNWNNPIAAILSGGMIPFWVIWALRSDTPDLMAAVFLLHLLLLLSGLQQACRQRTAICAGVIAGLLVLAKSYNFYFLLCFGAVCIVYFFVTGTVKKFLKPITGFALPFLAVCLTWILILSLQTKKIIFSSIAEHDICKTDLPLKNNPTVEPYDCSGLQLDSTVLISNWERPYLYRATRFSEAFTISKAVQRSVYNFKLFWLDYISWYQLILLFILLAITWKTASPQFTWSLLFTSIYCAGYFLFHLETRFFIFPVVLLMIWLSSLLILITENKNRNWQKWLGTVLMLLLFCKTPVLQLTGERVDPLPKTMYDFAKQNRVKGKRIAAEKGLFEDALYFCFFNRLQCAGALNADTNTSQAKEQLQKNKPGFMLFRDSSTGYRLIPFP
jgi:hypothetical protein